MPHYLCYDIKGIQHYIFQVPKLKCCIGGSRQIDEFDKKDVEKILQEMDGSVSCRLKKIYSGGRGHSHVGVRMQRLC